ncbi:MAG: 50S ribosomal protein L6 [Clostridiales Family XIII bacterium]|jgi:large subunit ribosomal protein L6|nr:50S ribosomal protein L6 [Clostridiales Family XIII bacterium]
MSRIGKKPVVIPAGVAIEVDADNTVSVKGPGGELREKISALIKLELKDGALLVTCAGDGKTARSAHGLSRSLIANMVTGVTDGFVKKLQINGVGYRAEKKGDALVLSLGYSHPVELKDPAGISTETPSPTEILVKGISKSVVGNYAAVVRSFRPPEPYKGKGIRYENEVIRRKEGKTGKK